MATYWLVAASLLAGILLQRSRLDVGRFTAGINRYIIYFALPALILGKVPGLAFEVDAMFPLLAPWLLAGLAFAMAIALGRHLGWDRQTVLGVALLAGLGNTAFMGLPLVDLLLGETALQYAVIYDQLGSFMVLSLVATSAIAMVAGSTSAPTAPGLARNILSFPPFLSLVLAMLLPAGFFYGFVELSFAVVGATILPLAMLMVGLQLSIRVASGHYFPVATVLGFKLLIAPALVLAAGKATGLDIEILGASVLQSAMPPMVTPAIMLIAAGIAPALVANTLGIATLVSLVTIPLFVQFAI